MKYDKERSREYCKISGTFYTNTTRVECKKTEVMPVIRVATETISKSLRQYLSNAPGKHQIKALHKTAHTGHCTQTAGSADVKAQNVYQGEFQCTCHAP